MLDAITTSEDNTIYWSTSSWVKSFLSHVYLTKLDSKSSLVDRDWETDGRRIAMSLVEAINTAQNEYHQSVNRQQKLLESLKEKRSDRLKNQLKENASILNLVEMWKSEESRAKMIKLAEMRKEAVAEEVEKLSTMDELKARIMGISEGEVLN